jgi:hypothetical protein
MRRHAVLAANLARFGPLCLAIALLGVGGKRTQDAELVAFRIGEHNPAHRPLAHVREPGTQTDQSLHLGLRGAANWAYVQMQAILHRLAFGNSDKDERRDARSPPHLLGQVSRLLLPRCDLDLSILGAHDVVAKRSGPERRLSDRVTAIDNDLSESEHRIYHSRTVTVPITPKA